MPRLAEPTASLYHASLNSSSTISPGNWVSLESLSPRRSGATTSAVAGAISPSFCGHLWPRSHTMCRVETIRCCRNANRATHVIHQLRRGGTKAVDKVGRVPTAPLYTTAATLTARWGHRALPCQNDFVHGPEDMFRNHPPSIYIFPR